MSERIEIEYALTVNVEDAATQLRQLERLLIRTLGLMQRIGLPPEINEAMEDIQRLIMLIRQLQIIINLFYAASGPLGWAILGVSAVATAFSIGDFIEYEMRGR